MIEMMDMVISDIAGDPRHERVGFQKAGRFEGRAFKSPAFIDFENDPGEIVLRVKEIRTQSAGNTKREQLDQHHRQPAKMNGQPDGGADMEQEGWNGINMLSWRFEEWQNHHSKNKHGEVPEQDGERMAHEQVKETIPGGSPLILFTGHDGKRTDVGAAQLAIVRMMVVMRTAPNRTGANKTNAVQAHDNRRHTRPGQNRMMLLVVIDHKQPDDEQPAQDTANDTPDQGQHRKSSRNSQRQIECGGKNTPPAFPRGIAGIRFGSGI